MVSPINYMLDVKDPIEQAMAGYAMGRGDIEQRQIMGVRRDQESRAAESFELQKEDRLREIEQQRIAAAQAAEVARRNREQAAQGQQAIVDLVNLGTNATPNDFLKALVSNPKEVERMSAVWAAMGDNKTAAITKDNTNLYALAANGDVSNMTSYLQERLDAQTASGGDEGVIMGLKNSIAQLESNPKEAMSNLFASAGMSLFQTKGADYVTGLNSVLGVGGFDVDKTNIIGGMAQIQTTANGETRVIDLATGKVVVGDEAEDLLKRANAKPDGVSITNVLGDAEGTLAKELAKGEAKKITASIDAGMKGSKRLRDLEALGELFTQVDTGASAAVKSFLGGYGIKTEGVDLIQAAEAIVSRLVPTAREPGSGPMSDKDLELFKATFPSILNTPSGNALILSTLEEVSKYEIAEGIIAGKVSDWVMTPPADRAAAEEAGLILSPKNGRKAIFELPKVSFTAPTETSAPTEKSAPTVSGSGDALDFSTMSAEDLSAVDVSSLNFDGLQAMDARYRELETK